MPFNRAVPSGDFWLVPLLWQKAQGRFGAMGRLMTLASKFTQRVCFPGVEVRTVPHMSDISPTEISGTIMIVTAAVGCFLPGCSAQITEW